MPCPLRVVLVAISAALLLFVASSTPSLGDCVASDTTAQRAQAQARHNALRARAGLTQAAQGGEREGSWAAARARLRRALTAAWRLASGRVLWEAWTGELTSRTKVA